MTTFVCDRSRNIKTGKTGKGLRMTDYFPHVRGSFSIYVGGRDDAIDQVRFVLGFFGEDPAKIVEAFWKEHR